MYHVAIAAIDAQKVNRALRHAVNGVLHDTDQPKLYEDASAIMEAALSTAPVQQAPMGLSEAQIDEFIADYEMRGEDEAGRDASYAPNERERILIKDAIMGLLADAPRAMSVAAVSEILVARS